MVRAAVVATSAIWVDVSAAVEGIRDQIELNETDADGRSARYNSL